MVRQLLAAGAAALLASACATDPGSRPVMFGGEHQPPAALVAALEAASAVPLPAVDYRALAAPGAVSARINAQSPVVALPGGRRFVAAYRIDALPRPLAIEVASQRTAEPGSALGALPDFRLGVFAPVVYMLDACGTNDPCARLQVGQVIGTHRSSVSRATRVSELGFVSRHLLTTGPWTDGLRRYSPRCRMAPG